MKSYSTRFQFETASITNTRKKKSMPINNWKALKRHFVPGNGTHIHTDKFHLDPFRFIRYRYGINFTIKYGGNNCRMAKEIEEKRSQLNWHKKKSNQQKVHSLTISINMANFQHPKKYDCTLALCKKNLTTSTAATAVATNNNNNDISTTSNKQLPICTYDNLLAFVCEKKHFYLTVTGFTLYERIPITLTWNFIVNRKKEQNKGEPKKKRNRQQCQNI